jgi:Flp pilus assembly pilin Flp
MLARSTLWELRRHLWADDGQDLAEYAILIGLIAVVVVGAVTLFGAQLTAMYDSFVSTLPFN